VTDARDTWQRAASPARRLGRRVEFHPVIASTNDRAREALATPDGDGLAVVADLQTDGRGRRGRAWLSPAGLNLMLSVGCRPHLSQPATGWLGAAVALAVRDACQSVVPASALAVRWPNDIVDANGAKLAGVLVETVIEGASLTEAVLGIGVNVNWRRDQMPAEIAERSTSLADLAGSALDRVAVLGVLLDRLDAEVALLEGDASPVPRLRDALAFRGRRVVVEQGEGRISGIVLGLDDDGALVIEAADGRHALSAGQVVRVSDATEATR
jgi:BirA family biotin operon repressor/biotin-[acetyl-CoA-carboxylase] ligase